MSGERWIEVLRWEEFQHYKDRDPKWIKNYTRLLHDGAYLGLPAAARGILHGLWLLRASTNEAPSMTRSRHLLSANKGDSRHFQEHIRALNHAGFIRVVASRPLAERYQDASPEKREIEPLRGSISPKSALASEPSDEARLPALEEAEERHSHRCNICGETLPKNISLEDHRRVKHGIMIRPEPEPDGSPPVQPPSAQELPDAVKQWLRQQGRPV